MVQDGASLSESDVHGLSTTCWQDDQRPLHRLGQQAHWQSVVQIADISLGSPFLRCIQASHTLSAARSRCRMGLAG
jgi:hypothetical protein